ANPAFRGLSAEEIYPLIVPDTPERTLDRHLFGPGAEGAAGTGAGQTSLPDTAGAPPLDGAPAADSWDDAGNEGRHGAARQRPPGAGPGERDELVRRWQARMASAAQQARFAGRLRDSWLRAVDGLIEPQLPWRVLLARYLMNAAREDYSFQRPSRREGEALLPRLAGGELDLHVALDTSGSIGAEELAQFTAELDALKGQV